MFFKNFKKGQDPLIDNHDTSCSPHSNFAKIFLLK